MQAASPAGRNTSHKRRDDNDRGHMVFNGSRGKLSIVVAAAGDDWRMRRRTTT